MIIVRIETDIVPCAPRQLFRTRLPGSLFYTNAPAGGNTGGGVWLCIGAQEVGGSDVQDVMDKKTQLFLSRYSVSSEISISS